jgi:hypothetical protein
VRRRPTYWIPLTIVLICLVLVPLVLAQPQSVPRADQVNNHAEAPLLQAGSGVVIISPTQLTLREGSAGAITFRLDRAPDSNVIIPLSPGAECSVTPTTVVLTNTTWNSGTVITVVATQDNEVEGTHTCTITTQLTQSNDADFNNLNPADIAIIIEDDEGTVTPVPTVTPLPTPTPPITNVSNEVRGLAMRTGPYLGATLIGSVVPGFEYNVLARSNDENPEYTWFLIEANGVTGWVSGRFLTYSGPEDVLPVQGSLFDAVDGAPDIGVFGITRSINDLRRRPSGRAQIISQIPTGAQVSIIGRTRQNGGDFWYQVRYAGQVGWIPAYVRRGDTSSVPIR